MTKQELIAQISQLKLDRNAILSKMTIIDVEKMKRLEEINFKIATYTTLLEKKDGTK